MSTKKFFTWVYWKVLLFLTNQAAWFISRGIGGSYFSRNFVLSFILWYDLKILVKSRGGGTFLCLGLSVNVWQKYFFSIWILNVQSFIFLIWMEQFRIWFSWKLSKNIEIFIVFYNFHCFFFNFPYFTPSTLLNLGSDLSNDDIVQLGSAGTKIGSQNAVMKVLELTGKRIYPNFRGKF